MNANPITLVAMAEMNVMSTQSILRTCGLGSCIGLSLYDPIKKIGGLAHIMLPTSAIYRGTVVLNQAKYVDTAVPELVHRMLKSGASKQRLHAKIAGGAQMFSLHSQNDLMKIGWRNVESCRQMLQYLQIPLVSEDTGGNYGRTIDLYCETGDLLVRSVKIGVKEL